MRRLRLTAAATLLGLGAFITACKRPPLRVRRWASVSNRWMPSRVANRFPLAAASWYSPVAAHQETRNSGLLADGLTIGQKLAGTAIHA